MNKEQFTPPATAQFTGTILDEIVAWNRADLARRRERVSVADLEALVADRPAPRNFMEALRRPAGDRTPRLIAEAKRASPSKGLLVQRFDPVRLARDYAEAGAAAISVLTERRYFRGDPGYVEIVRQAASVPILRKDFLFDEYQIVESRALGADALLLIVAVLHDRLADLLAATHALGMLALVEVHDDAELTAALVAGAEIIGINNRDLRSFRVDLETTGRLRALVPPGRIVVSESGVQTSADVDRLREWDVDAMLVGESLVTARDVSRQVRELLGVGKSSGK